MRGLAVALAAFLALAGLVAAAAAEQAGAGGLGGVFSWRRGRALSQTGASNVALEGFSSSSNSITLTVKQRDPSTQLRYGLIRFTNNAWPSSVTQTYFSGEDRVAIVPQSSDDATLKIYKVTLSNISAAITSPTGYYRVVVGRYVNDAWFSTVGPTDGGLAVGMPSAITITSVTNVPSTNTLRVSFEGGLQNTAGAYQYKVYKFGTSHTDSANVVYTSDRVEITPWTTATTTFDTPALSPGLYSVWVEAQHPYDSNLAVNATTGESTSYAIGTANAPEIVRADEPVESTGANKFVVFFKYPATNNVQKIGYSLEDVNSPLTAVTATCDGSECPKVAPSTKYLATVLAAGDGAPSGATHKLETGTVPKGLYKIKLWGFNDITSDGTASSASTAVATFDTPGVPAGVSAVQSSDLSDTLVVQFDRTVDKIASAYYYDVKDAAGALVITNQLAGIADVTQNTLQFTTATISQGSQRYSVTVRACTGQATKCSSGADSNLAGIGQPTAPQNVEIAAGMTTLTITWKAPATDTASAYTVQIFSDTGDTTFSGTAAGSWADLPWNDSPDAAGLVYTPAESTYTYTTPVLTPGTATGYYRAQVLALHPRYASGSTESGTSNTAPQRAALGNPGPLSITSVDYLGENTQISIAFKEGAPMTAERYAVTVYSRATANGANQDVENWAEVSVTATAAGAGKLITLSTASGASPAWPGPGRYVFVVHAGNAAGGVSGYNVQSATSGELVVGPPGRPSTTASDTASGDITIGLVLGNPDLAEIYGVEVYGYNYAANTCGNILTAIDFASPATSSSTVRYTPATGVTQATYCFKGYAFFDDGVYPQETATVVHLGTPETPNTPTLVSGTTTTGLTVWFDCPTIWNSRYMTYELTRVDMGRTDVVTDANPSAASNPSPKLVRGKAGTGEKALKEEDVSGVRKCSFTIPSEDIPNANLATSNVGKYKIKLKAHNNAASSVFSADSADAWLGEPDAPANVEVTNSNTNDTAITISMDAPAADVHGGFVLRLNWLRGATSEAVTTTNDANNIYVPRSAVDTNTNGKWKVSFLFSNMLCGGNACTKGRFEVAAVGALSRFDTNGAFQADGNYKQGTQKLLETAAVETLPEIYYGNPDTPASLAILNSLPVRILDPTATTLDLQFDVPDADVAVRYEYELYFFMAQGDTSEVTPRTVTGKVDRSALGTGTSGKYTLNVNLASLDCEPSSASTTENCGSGSYQLKSFKALTRVDKTTGGGQDSSSSTLSGLTDVIIVGSNPAMPTGVNVPDVKFASSSAADTVIYIEVDLPSDPTKDNIQGWAYKLQFLPGNSATLVDVNSGAWIYTARADIVPQSNRLRIPVPKLSALTCGAGDCSAGGKFQLTDLKSVSWFNDAGAVVTALADGATSASTTDWSVDDWDQTFLVGSPAAAPSGIRVPDVPLASSPLLVYLTAPVADNAKSYEFTLERIKGDGTTEAVTTPISVSARTLRTNEFELTIATSSTNNGLHGPGRYKLTAAASVASFDTPGTPDRQTATSLAIYFIYGSPSDVPAPIANVAVPNVLTGPSIQVKFDAPAADVARYYTITVDYYSGAVDNSPGTPNPKNLQLTTAAPVVDVVVTDCTTTGKQALAKAYKTVAAGTSLVVRCSAACDTDNTAVYSAASVYLFTSAICRAATHAGLTATNPFKLMLSAGGALPRDFTASTNGGTASDALTGFNTAADNWDMALAAESAPTEAEFTVPRTAATLDGTKLVLTVDLSQAACRASGTTACGDGKYVVKQVKAWPWFDSNKYSDEAAGAKTSGAARTAYTFVGEPAAPENPEGLNAVASGSTVTLRFDRPEADNAQAYTFVLTKYFPGGTEVDQQCTGQFDMPTTTAGTAPTVDGTDSKKWTITVGSLQPSPDGVPNKCATLLGKFKVTEFKATSWHGSAAAPSTTAATTYFYIGPVGAIDSVSPASNAANSGAALDVSWVQASPDPAMEAVYSLQRYYTGDDSTGTAVCTDVAVTAAELDRVSQTGTVTVGGVALPQLQLTGVPLCDLDSNADTPDTLAKGRYKVSWTVQGWTTSGATLDTNQAVKQFAATNFFYIGTPTAPAKPTLTSQLEDSANSTPKRLRVEFATPSSENDNAERYTYDLVQVANPSIDPSTATAGPDTFTLVHDNLGTPTGIPNSYSTTTNTFYLTGLPDGLYRLRVKSVIGAASEASAWSDVIGTGSMTAKPTIVSVQDGLNSLTVTFNLVSNAVKYKYTLLTEGVSGSTLSGHANVEMATSSITFTGSTQGSFVIDSTPAALPAGRYKVQIAAFNDAAGVEQTAGYQEPSAMAAVGVPSKPSLPSLTVPKDGSGNPIKRALEVTVDKPDTDSALEYYYVLYRADSGTGGQCYTTAGVMVDTVSNSEGITVTLPNGALTANPSGETRTFRLTNIPDAIGNYDFKVRVGVKNSLVASQNLGGVTGVTVCGSATTQLDSSVYWSELSSAVTAIDDPTAPGQPSVTYDHLAKTLVVIFTAPATARSYTYKVVDVIRIVSGSPSVQVPMTSAAEIDPTALTGASIDLPEISTSSWPQGRYQLIVYVQSGFASGEDSPSTASLEFYVGTPDVVTNVKLENKAGSSDTITVSYTPPAVDIAQLMTAGSYRYTVQERLANYNFADLPGSVNVDTGKPVCTGTSPTIVCTFDISGLADGLYKVKVWGRTTYPKPAGGGDDEAAGSPVASAGDNIIASTPHMRDGTVAVGTPGAPLVSLTGALDGLTIGVTGITDSTKDNALQFKWVYLKDGDTTQSTPAPTAAPRLIPTSGTESIDPLTIKGSFPKTYKMDLDALLCGGSSANECKGTYRVGVSAVNGAGESAYTWTTVAADGTSIVGGPDQPSITQFVVKDGTMETVTFAWSMGNTWTALATDGYSYTIANVLDVSEGPYTGTLSSPQAFDVTVTGSGLYKVTVVAKNKWTTSSSGAQPSTGLVVGLPLVGGAPVNGLRSVSVTRSATVDGTKRDLSINFLDKVNSWVDKAGSCETTYEWEVVTSPGLIRVASSSVAVNPCTETAVCTGTDDLRGCFGITTDNLNLADGRYQVFLLAYNQFGYTRSEASNVVTVGTPSSSPLDVTATDGAGQIGISFASATAGPHRCQGKGAVADATPAWSVVKQLASGATSFTITTTDVPELSTAKRWLVQCERADDWANLSAPKYAASGAPTMVGKPTLAAAPASNGIKFTFAPADPDAAITYRFVLKKSGVANVTKDVAFDSKDLQKNAGNLEYTWAAAPSGSLTGIVRSINGVAEVDSDESDPLEVGQPGKVGKPVVQSGLTGFVVSFSPGSPSAATAYYYNVYKADDTPVGTLNQLKADVGTATGSTAPTTPSGSTAYASLTPSDLLTFSTGDLKTAIALVEGFYKISVVAYNEDASAEPTDLRFSQESDKSELVALGRPGVPRNLAVTAGLRKLKVEFSIPNPDTAAYYEYTVRSSTGLKPLVTFTSSARVARGDVSISGSTVAFETQQLPANAAYGQYELRVAAVGTGSVFSSWSTPAVTGVPTKPTGVTLTPGSTSLGASFTGPALLDLADSFAYKLYTLGAAPVQVGDANGYLVPRANITGDLATSGVKSFSINLDSAYGELTAPAGGYYVEVFTARQLAVGFEAGAVSDQAGPATLGAPTAATAKPVVNSVTTDAIPKATIQWAYADSYSTYTGVAWRIKRVGSSTVDTSGTITRADAITAAVTSPLTATIDLKYNSGEKSGEALRGRFTVELCMANDQVTCTDASSWTPASDAFAAGAPTAPTSVTISSGPLSGAFVLPAEPAYDTLAYRLVPIKPEGADGALLFGASWKDLTDAEISAGSFTIPDPVTVGGTSYAVPNGRYRLDMQASNNNGATAEYVGRDNSQALAIKGTPAAVTSVAATSGDTSVTLTFEGSELATSYKVQLLDSDGIAVPGAASVALSATAGVGPKTATLGSAELGDQVATYKFKVESYNDNGQGTTSSPSNLVILGQLATPSAPELEWFNPSESGGGYAELRFTAITAPAGASPAYEYQLYDASQSPAVAVGSWQAIDLTGNSGSGTALSPYKVSLVPSPGRYTATLRATTALGASATSAESLASPAEVVGVTSQPGIQAVGSGDSAISTDEANGDTTIVLLVTLPTNNYNSDGTKPKLQLRIDTEEPAPASQGNWEDVAATCTDASTPLCISGSNAGTSADPQRVRVKLSGAAPRRLKFVARTENDNGPGLASAASNAVTVGLPKPPTVTAASGAEGIKMVFVPDTLLTGDTFKYWAEDASAGSGAATRLAEADVVTRSDGKYEFFVPLANFEGNDVPWTVTMKMVAVNANTKRSTVATSAAVTVGRVTAPTGVTAAVGSGATSVTVSWTPGDTTYTTHYVKAYSEKATTMVFSAAGAIPSGSELGYTLDVGGGSGQLPPGRWQFAVVAINANSQAESGKTSATPAGVPGAPLITKVAGGYSGSPALGTAQIAFTLAGDNLADKLRISYSSAALGTWTEASTESVSQIDTSVTVTGLPTGNWWFRLEAGNTANSIWSSPSTAWPATTVGLPGALTINAFAGALDTITLTVTQAADKTATAFVLMVHDASGTEISDYSAPLLSTSAPDGNGRQRVVFGTDTSRLGEIYRFKVAAINALGTGDFSGLTDAAVAAYKPATPTSLVATGRTDRATLTFLPTAGAVSFEAAILPATGDWRVATDALAPYAPLSVQTVDVGGTTKLTFDVPLSAFAYRDGQYTFKVRGLDANGVPGDWSSASTPVSVGAPDTPTALTVTSTRDSSAVDLSFVPAWLAEQGYEIEVLSQDGKTVLDTLTVSASSCAVKAAAPQ